MWPVDPDDFESLVVPPEGASRDEAWFFIRLRDGFVCVSEQGAPRPVTGDELRWMDIDVRAELYLGEHRGRSVYAVIASGGVPEGYALAGLRDLLGRVEPSVFYLAGRAQQIIDWHEGHQFCGRCGNEMDDHPKDRAKFCGNCNAINYPKLAPSIIVLVTNGDQMLLARNANWPTNMFSTLAGFVEPGESIEQTVHREVLEEVGLSVGNLEYFGSQSWPFPNSLMLGFHAEYRSGEIVCQDEEIAEARWFDLDNLPNMPPKTAISRWLIDEFIGRVEARLGG
jgi:NAD+ diphosphatase